MVWSRYEPKRRNHWRGPYPLFSRTNNVNHTSFLNRPNLWFWYVKPSPNSVMQCAKRWSIIKTSPRNWETIINVGCHVGCQPDLLSNILKYWECWNPQVHIRNGVEAFELRDIEGLLHFTHLPNFSYDNIAFNKALVEENPSKRHQRKEFGIF